MNLAIVGSFIIIILVIGILNKDNIIKNVKLDEIANNYQYESNQSDSTLSQITFSKIENIENLSGKIITFFPNGDGSYGDEERFFILGYNNENIDYLYKKDGKYYIKLGGKYNSEFIYNGFECKNTSGYKLDYTKEYDKILKIRQINNNKKCILAEKGGEKYYIIYSGGKLKENKIEFLGSEDDYGASINFEGYFPKYCLYTTYNDKKTIVYLDGQKIGEYEKIYDNYDYINIPSFGPSGKGILVYDDFIFIGIKNNKYYIVFNGREKELEEIGKIRYLSYENGKAYVGVDIFKDNILIKFIEYEFDGNKLSKKETNYETYYNKYSKKYPGYNYYDEINGIVVLGKINPAGLSSIDSKNSNFFIFDFVKNDKKLGSLNNIIYVTGSYIFGLNTDTILTLLDFNSNTVIEYESYDLKNNILILKKYKDGDEKTHILLNNKIYTLDGLYDCVNNKCEYLCNYSNCYDINLNKINKKLVYINKFYDFDFSILEDNGKYILYSGDKIYEFNEIIKINNLYAVHLDNHSILLYDNKLIETNKKVINDIIDFVNKNKLYSLNNFYYSKNLNIEILMYENVIRTYYNGNLIFEKLDKNILNKYNHEYNGKVILLLNDYIYIFDKNGNVKEISIDKNYNNILFKNGKIILSNFENENWFINAIKIDSNIFDEYITIVTDETEYICK